MLRCSKSDFEEVGFSCGNPILGIFGLPLATRNETEEPATLVMLAYTYPCANR